MVSKILPNKVWLIGTLVIIGLGAAFWLLVGWGAKSSITDQRLQSQQLLARAESNNLTSFFHVFGDSISVLAQLKTITNPNSSIWDLNAFVEQWRDNGVVYGVALVDNKGLLKLNSNIEGTHETGVSLVDRDYFPWAKDKTNVGKYFIGKPVISRLGATKGQMIVPVASPVYQDGNFMGVLVAAVELKALTRHYLELMKVSDATQTYLLNQDGNILYSSASQEKVGVAFSGDKSLTSLLNSALEMKGEASERIGNNLIAYASVQLGDQNWLIVMSTPINNIWNDSVPMPVRLVAFGIILSLTTFWFAIMSAKEAQKRL